MIFFIVELRISDPVFNEDDYYYLSTEEKYDRNVKKFAHLVKIMKELNLPQDTPERL